MKVKICGITHPDDAIHAARHGADYIGITLSNRSKRKVCLDTAERIAQATRQAGAEPVLLCVDETIEEILTFSKMLEIHVIQLHHSNYFNLLDHFKNFTIIYCVEVQDDGMLSPIPAARDNLIILFDSPRGGSGRSFDWMRFSLPQDMHSRPWMLAGGLHPDNIHEAIESFKPSGVDVASGVEYAASTRKDPHLIQSFIALSKKRTQFGGQFLPEILMTPIQQLTKNWNQLKTCPDFQQELEYLLTRYAGRKTPLTEIKNFAKAIHGPRIFLKREDLLHTGAHKINNALGQCLLAKYLGKTRIIAETGAGQHGVATATACAHLGLDCVIYMGAKDIERQKLNVMKMQLLGAEVHCVSQGSATLKDAINEALRDWSSHYESTHYCLGSALGPHPYPEMVRSFQSVISAEVKEQILEATGQDPSVMIACIGGGSNAIGFFHHFIDETRIQLIGVEAGGKGLSSGMHAARFSGGCPGVLHGCYTYVLQDQEGQIQKTHSISAGLDYPAVGPDHAMLFEAKRVEYTSITDEEALNALYLLSKTEGIIPALESSHALAHCIKIASTLDKDSIVIVNLSGRGDKDLPQIFENKL